MFHIPIVWGIHIANLTLNIERPVVSGGDIDGVVFQWEDLTRYRLNEIACGQLIRVYGRHRQVVVNIRFYGCIDTNTINKGKHEMI